MKKIIKPNRKSWTSLSMRPEMESFDLNLLVSKIFNEVKKDGDKALMKFRKLYDTTSDTSLIVENKSLKIKSKIVSPELRKAIQLAKKNIEKFHSSQQEKIRIIETMKGVECWRESRAIERIGIYIPGGTAPLFSTVLMLGIPAILVGCKEIILCTPPNKNGEINPVVLYTASLIGITRVYSIGGIQAIAAMSIGTKTIPKVDKIFGPGNQYVTAAKRHAANLGTAIDMPAGPSEVLVIADDSCNPSFVAADLLSQAEHGTDSQVMLLTDKEKIIDRVFVELKKQIKNLPRKKIAARSLFNSKAIVFKNIETCIGFSNQYAPEHLILAIRKPENSLKEISNAGSVFLGNYSCESLGDYASGTNHTLPTNGHARSYSGVSLDSFVKKITFQRISKKGIQKIGPAVEHMAEAEKLTAHKNAVTIRLKGKLK